MPRRPPPSALLLHPGPTPPRSQPKHTLPSLPRPALYPSKTSLHAHAYAPALVRVTSRESSTKMTAAESARVLPPAPVTALSNTPAPAPAPAAAWLWSWLPGSTEKSPTSSSSSNPSPTRSARARDRALSVRGPWDHSRSLSESMLDIDSLIKAPKPAAVTVNPLSSAVW